jgi:hypothetical protein
MVKRVFKEHQFAFSFIAINTFIVVEEFARLYLSHPKFTGLGWYWTAALSFPCSLLLYVIHWPWSADFLSMVFLVLLGALQWGVVGAALDHSSRTRHSSAKT